MPPCNAKREFNWPRCRFSLDLPAVVDPVGRSCDVCSALKRKGQCFARTGHFLPQRGVGIICREHRNALGAKCVNDRAVFKRNGFYGGHEFQMLALGVVHQRNGGTGQPGQVGNLTGVVHAEFDHADLMRRPQAQQRQRHANVVVEIALRRKGSIGFVGAQN